MRGSRRQASTAGRVRGARLGSRVGLPPRSRSPIITIHITRNEAAAPGYVCPGIRIHAIDIVQPPGIGMPIADMDAHQTTESVVLPAKSNAERKARSEARSQTIRRHAFRLLLA